MLSEKQTKELIEYWFCSSQEDLKTATALYQSKRYAGCLFWCHLLLEKILKALMIQKTKNHAPKIHNLRRLAELAELELKEKELDLLSEVNMFNTRTRYPDEKLEFSKQCTKTYTDKYYNRIISIYKKLCQKVKPQK